MAEKEENSRLIVQNRFGTEVEMEAAISRLVSSRDSSKPGLDHSLLCCQIYSHRNQASQPYMKDNEFFVFICAKLEHYNVTPCYKISFISGFCISNSKSNRAWLQSQNSAAAVSLNASVIFLEDEKETMVLMCRNIFLTHEYKICLVME